MRAKLHWNEINNIKALKGSVWTELADIDDGSHGTRKKRLASGIALDVQRFEELFCVVPGSDKKDLKKPKMVSKRQFRTLLDMRRSNNICIGISRFARKGMEVPDILTAVRSLNVNKLSVDDLISLQRLLPTNEERALLAKHSNSKMPDSDLPLGPAEDFLLKVIEERGFPQMIVGFVFMLQYRSELNDLMIKYGKIKDVCLVLKNSERLKILLKTILQLGNLTNYEYGAGSSSYKPWMGKEAKALGFRIDGMARLKDVKSADGKWNLMNFLVDMVEQSKPEVSIYVNVMRHLIPS